MHTNKVTLAVLVDGKSLYEDKDKIYMPFGTEYELFVKNDNSFDVKVEIKLGLTFSDDIFLIQANTKRTIKGFSHQGAFYKYKFIEKIKEIKKAQPFNNACDNLLSFNIYRCDIGSCLLERPSLVINKPTVTFNDNDPFSIKKPLTDFDSLIKNKTSIPQYIDENREDIKEVREGINNILKQNRNIKDNLNSIANSSTPSLNSDQNSSDISGFHAFGEPTDERITSKPQNHNLLFSGFFNILGVDDYDNRIYKPLFSKDNLKCSVCHSKARLKDRYCSVCGSFVIRTANVIDKPKASKKIKECCNTKYPNDFMYCPKCSELLVFK